MGLGVLLAGTLVAHLRLFDVGKIVTRKSRVSAGLEQIPLCRTDWQNGHKKEAIRIWTAYHTMEPRSKSQRGKNFLWEEEKLWGGGAETPLVCERWFRKISFWKDKLLL